MEQRRPAPRQSDNKDWLADLLVHNFRKELPVAFDQQSVTQRPNDVGT
jgi:hypothetical protein